MFDKNEQIVDIKPACSGFMQKSHPKSFFKWCRVDIYYMRENVDGNPRVLQIMVFGDDNMLIEMLPEDVYSEWVAASKSDNS